MSALPQPGSASRSHPNDRAGLPVWMYVGIWIGGCAGLVGALLAAANLLAIDEARYAGVAWEMLTHNHWLVPHKNGQPYSDKPPLLFWLLAGGWWLLGPSVAWARLVPGLFALATLTTTGLLARGLWPRAPRAALLAPTVLLGFPLWALWTPLLMFDVVLTFWVLVAIAGVALAGLRGRRSGWLLVALGLGLGTLTKGPVAFLHALPVMLLAPLWRPRPHRGWWPWYACVLLACLTGAGLALAWALPAAQVGGTDYARAILWDQSAGRVSDSFAHEHGPLWYLLWLPLLLFPWILWPSTWSGLVRLRPRADAGVRFLTCWLLPVFAAFCLISGKQIHYLLPLLPGMALLLARGLSLVVDRPGPGGVGLLVALPLAALAGGLLALPRLQAALDWPAWTGQLPAALPWTVGGLALLPLIPRQNVERRATLIALASVGTIASLMLGAVGTASPHYDWAPVAALVAQAQSHNRPVAFLGHHHNGLQFPGRLQAPVTELGSAEAARSWAADRADGLIVALYDRPPPCELVFRQRFRGGWLGVLDAVTVNARPTCLPSGR